MLHKHKTAEVRPKNDTLSNTGVLNVSVVNIIFGQSMLTHYKLSKHCQLAFMLNADSKI